MRKAAGIIPARYQSSRFPGKPLVSILGKPLIQRVYEGVQKAKSLERLIIATDDERIFNAAKKFGAEVVMTSASHASGTERVAEVAKKITSPLVINIQGDEPLIEAGMIDGLAAAFQDDEVPMASLMARVTNLGLIKDPHIVKVVVDKEGWALYFSRQPIPSAAQDFFFRHIGIYGYQREFLLKFARLEPTRLEICEKLEQLRAMENGYRIKMIEVPRSTLSVDTPQDIIRVEKFLREEAEP